MFPVYYAAVAFPACQIRGKGYPRPRHEGVGVSRQSGLSFSRALATAIPGRRSRELGRVGRADVKQPGYSVYDGLGGQLSVGGIAGFATGYAVRRVGQLLLAAVGCEIVALQLMARRGWVDVKWDRITNDISPHVEKDGLERVVETLKFKLPFAGAFSAGVYAGFRWS